MDVSFVRRMILDLDFMDLWALLEDLYGNIINLDDVDEVRILSIKLKIANSHSGIYLEPWATSLPPHPDLNDLFYF